jgi:hypothetical protein
MPQIGEKKAHRIQLFCLMSIVASKDTKIRVDEALATAWNSGSPKALEKMHRNLVKANVELDTINYRVAHQSLSHSRRGQCLCSNYLRGT